MNAEDHRSRRGPTGEEIQSIAKTSRAVKIIIAAAATLVGLGLAAGLNAAGLFETRKDADKQSTVEAHYWAVVPALDAAFRQGALIKGGS